MNKATPTGFEPVRAEPNGLAGRRLNHSAKVSVMMIYIYTLRCVNITVFKNII